MKGEDRYRDRTGEARLQLADFLAEHEDARPWTRDEPASQAAEAGTITPDLIFLGRGDHALEGSRLHGLLGAQPNAEVRGVWHRRHGHRANDPDGGAVFTLRLPVVGSAGEAAPAGSAGHRLHA